MPRRPRPASRAPPASARPLNKSTVVPKATISKPAGAKAPDQQPPSQEAGPSSRAAASSASEEEEEEEDEDAEQINDSYGGQFASESEASVPDVDAPRVAQWEDDELEVNAESDGEEDEEEASEMPDSTLKSLQQDLLSLPLGALKKAQRTLVQATAISDSDSDQSEWSDEEHTSSKAKEKAKPEWSTRPRPDLAKRANKHAPQEVTSKRPVSRKRTVVEVKTYHPQDPRFLPLAGEFSETAFHNRYSFLKDSHISELQTLRENLKRARKLLVTSPQHLRDEREEEVNKLELAVKRAESLVNRDRRQQIEKEALQKITSEEKAKQKQGKGKWFMKESDKKAVLLRARYEALATAGGKGAVRKAIEKKQKKISQREKKSRPFARSRPASEAGSRGTKRPSTDSGGPPFKRRRGVE